nr:putative IGR protein [Ipomoea batatas]
MAWRQTGENIFSPTEDFLLPIPSNAAVSPFAGFSSFLFQIQSVHSEVGIPEFLTRCGKGRDPCREIESEIGDFQKLRLLELLGSKRLGIPVKQGSYTEYTHKYKLGLWRARAEPVKS